MEMFLQLTNVCKAFKQYTFEIVVVVSDIYECIPFSSLW